MDTLIIDDNPTGIFLTTRLLRREGQPADVITAFVSPVEAVAFFRQQVLTGPLPQLVLLDLNMPLLSGWDVLDALKPLEAHLLDRCVFYVLTSSLAPADAARARQYPLVAGVLHKPLDGAKIQAMHARLQQTRPT
ncbi:response regulator receiver protein [Hymenobacter roseosalivarius DSM 11622]|uniref:Response regulator receiver protein n=1 Tax=Hymenobacter roseosalivarius DSM 11622 TaxID=645990 RepID=A0A1W1W2F7_9BACT|nr:response regulator [Hymenobacter roseosalivarius]SMB99683.1 response regulator receiver protein [Hymenobacter roseosalivarius DSM 11622]